MAEIKVQIKAMETGIGKLNALKQEIDGFDTKSPDVSDCGGKTIGEMEAIAQLYKDLNKQMSTLVANTAAFMTNVKDSYVASDQKAAASMKSK